MIVHVDQEPEIINVRLWCYLTIKGFIYSFVSFLSRSGHLDKPTSRILSVSHKTRNISDQDNIPLLCGCPNLNITSPLYSTTLYFTEKFSTVSWRKCFPIQKLSFLRFYRIPFVFPQKNQNKYKNYSLDFFCLFNIRYFYSLKFSDKLFSLSNCYWWLCIKRIQPIRYSVFIIEILVNVIKFEIVLNICKPNQEVIQKKKILQFIQTTRSLSGWEF